MRLQIFGWLGVSLLCVSVGYSCPAAQLDPSPIATAVSQGVGKVARTEAGDRGAPIIVLEETHGSQSGDIQEATILFRLHRDYKLREIGLEGYLKGRADLSSKWLDQTSKEDSKALFRTAVSLLKDGEINAAEFMKLTSDVNIRAVENESDYVRAGEDSEVAPLMLVFGIAEKEFIREAKTKTKAELTEFLELRKALDKDDSSLSAQQRYQDFLLKANPWAKNMYRSLIGEDPSIAFDIDKQISQLDEIERRTRDDGIEVPQKIVSYMADQRRFLKARANASVTMVREIGKIADDRNVRITALIIGAAHTPAMGSLLKEAKRPFAIISPNALAQKSAAHLSYEKMQRKYRSLPVEDDLVSKALLHAFPVKIKPQPVMDQDWFKAKAEMNYLIDRLTKKALQPASGGGAPPIPPGPIARSVPGAPGSDPNRSLEAFFKDNELESEHVKIDAARAEVRVDPSGTKSIVFPVILNPRDPSKKSEIWVNSTLNQDRSQPVGRLDEEQELIAALRDVEGQKVEQKAEGTSRGARTSEGGRPTEVQMVAELRPRGISTDVKAVVGATREQVLQATIGRQ